MLITGNDGERLGYYTILENNVNMFGGFPKKYRLYNYDKDNKKYYYPIARNNELSFYEHRIDESLSYLMYTGKHTDEQQYIIDDIVNEGRYCGTIMLKTGRGKSHIIFGLISLFQTSTLILCHNIDTANDMYEKIKKFTNISEGDLGIVHSKVKSRHGKVTITTHASFQKKYKEFPRYDMILYDECDYNLSFPTGRNYDCMSTALIMSDANIIFGFSGTPYRDGVGSGIVTKMFGEIIMYNGQDMNGYNILPTINRVIYKNKAAYLFSTWSELREQMINDKKRTDLQLDYIVNNLGAYSLVLMENIVEVDSYYENLYYTEDYEVIKLHGQMGRGEYSENLELLTDCISNKKKFIIVATADKIGRGVDIPIIDTIFLFFPCKFQGTIVQAVGRALRKYEGKTIVNVYDWVDKGVLNKQASERLKSYKCEYGESIVINEKSI